MLAAVGHPVRRLHRSGYGPLTVAGLEPGDWRELEPDRDSGAPASQVMMPVTVTRTV